MHCRQPVVIGLRNVEQRQPAGAHLRHRGEDVVGRDRDVVHAATAIVGKKAGRRGALARGRVERQTDRAVAAFQHAALDQPIRIDQLVRRLGFEAEHRLVEQQRAVELAARHHLRDVIDLG